jgi:H+-translocating NAD(P) transhydrogenase subunit alpha
MKIAILKEKAKGESRVAVTPDIAAKFIKAGYDIAIEKGAGEQAGFLDQEYADVGAKLSSVPLEIISDADIILKVQPTPSDVKTGEVDFAKKGAVVIGFLSPHNNKFLTQTYAEKNITSLAMELVPRTTKAQSMDALSSQSNLGGYRAVIEAAYHYKKGMPMLMTAAGTVVAAKVLVLGAGVAGLQAIATAKRLGGAVTGYDVRAAAGEQVESLGGKFICVEGEALEGTGGYAAIGSEEFNRKQEALLKEYVQKQDIVITTAQIPGKPAPKLITKDMVNSMKTGSIIVDMATASGGNVEVSEKDKIVSYNGVTIIGNSNLANNVAYDASKLYARNLFNLVQHIFQDKKLHVDDEIASKMLLTHKGKILSTIIG